MTKRQQIEILSRICDTDSMVSDDRNDLREVIEEMKSEPEPQFITAYTLDKLISMNGDWKLCYVYNRFGYNTLMILPTDEGVCSIDDAAEILLDMNEGDFEHSLIIDHYIRSCPNNPFIIRENGFIECVKELTSRLFQLIGEDGDFDKFHEESEKFFDFIGVCKQIHDREEGFVHQVLNKGWEKFVPKKPIKREFDKEYKLLAELYEESYYPDHLLDIIKAILISIIHKIELGDTDIDRIKREFQTFIATAISMIYNFADNVADINTRGDSMRTHDIYIITKDVEYILSRFAIDISIKDIVQQSDCNVIKKEDPNYE